MISLSRRIVLAGLGVLFLASAPIVHAVYLSPPATASHESSLTRPRVDVFADGKVVISLDAVGDLPGVITLNLTPAGDGTYNGNWAFAIAEGDTTDPDTGVEPETQEHGAEAEHAEGHEGAEAPHKDFFRITPRGSMGGSVTGATLSLNQAGLEALSASLEITVATQEFDGATGSGTATLSSLSLSY